MNMDEISNFLNDKNSKQMRPEDVFKIEDSSEISNESIPEKETTKNTENTDDIKVPNKRELTLEDLMNYLEKNKVKVDKEVLEKTYNDIITNKKEKESITSIIEKLEKESKIIIEKIESGDPKGEGLSNLNKELLKINDELSNSNVVEREKEDNIKNIINNIFENKIENKTENTNKNDSSQTSNNLLNVKNELLQIITKGIESKNENIENVNIPQKENVENINVENIPQKENVENINVENIPQKVENTNIENFSNLNDYKSLGNSNISNTTNNNILNSNKSEFSINNETATDLNGNKLNEKEEQIKSDILKTTEELKKTSDNTLQNLEVIQNQTPEIESGDKNAALLAATEKTHELISKLSENISSGFDSMHSKMGLLNRGYSGENSQNQTNIMQNSQNHIHSNDIAEKNYVDEYRASLRSNLPLTSLMGISTELKGNNIGSYV